MNLLAVLLLLPIFSLLAMVCLPSRLANKHARRTRQLVTRLVGTMFFIAIASAIAHLAGGGAARSWAPLTWLLDTDFNLDFYFDGGTQLMMLLVSFIGLVVCRFSSRYLDGEAKQGRYFRWLGFTIGAVSLLIVAGNMLLFVTAWVMTSLGLHQLLLHYHHRRAAHRAAWTKFTISRLGDGFLIAALVLIYRTYGTFEFTGLFAMANELAGTSQVAASHAAIGWLLVLGAVTKSAQFPFHTWLPETMETPTPVSALMHAGIVNAGGFLVIRMSPLISLAPAALIALAIVGAFTACFAGLVMMTQASIKRTLAYSTIAQMGFMMFQCGLGAFSAAMLHILAHSLYKAHAFLSSGSVVAEAKALAGSGTRRRSAAANLGFIGLAAAMVFLAYVAMNAFFGIDVSQKPGGLVLALILCLALTTWSARLFSLREKATSLTATAGIVCLCLMYVAGYHTVDYMLAASVPNLPELVPANALLIGGLCLPFILLFALYITLTVRQPAWLAAWRVHAANGFYVDAFYQRIVDRLTRA